MLIKTTMKIIWIFIWLLAIVIAVPFLLLEIFSSVRFWKSLNINKLPITRKIVTFPRTIR
jgi:hypothetical protein